MRYMLLQAYGGVELVDCPSMDQWAPADVQAHIDFQRTMNAELLERGELVDAQYPESKELLAGFRIVDVDSLERALEIAARSSASPGPRGVPIQQRIEVRQVISAPEPSEL